MDKNIGHKKRVIIDTGCANVSSVRFAIERLGFDVAVSFDAKTILGADTLFLPGVGTALEAMKNLKARNLISIIEQIEQPLLGICLGMQLLGRVSQEGALNEMEPVQTLGHMDADTVLMGSHFLQNQALQNQAVQNQFMPNQAMQNQAMQNRPLPLPHMGWNTVRAQKDHPLFKNIPQDSYFYFVHRYAMPINGNTVAQCDYGYPFSAAVQKGHFYGVQFHPERSSQAGATLIKNFLEM